MEILFDRGISAFAIILAVALCAVIVRRRLYGKLEFQACLILLGLYVFSQVGELLGPLSEHFFMDIFKLAPVFLIVLFELGQDKRDRAQEAELSRLKIELEKVEKNMSMQKVMHTL